MTNNVVHLVYPIYRQKGFFMKTLRILKQWMTDGCIYYTVISVLFLFISLAMGNDTDRTLVRESSFLLMLPCGLVISIGTQLLRTKKMPRWSRYLSHYLLTVLGVFLFLWLPADSSATPMAGFLMLVLFSVLYWLIFLVALLVRSRYRKLMED